MCISNRRKWLVALLATRPLQSGSAMREIDAHTIHGTVIHILRRSHISTGWLAAWSLGTHMAILLRDNTHTQMDTADRQFMCAFLNRVWKEVAKRIASRKLVRCGALVEWYDGDAGIAGVVTRFAHGSLRSNGDLIDGKREIYIVLTMVGFCI